MPACCRIWERAVRRFRSVVGVEDAAASGLNVLVLRLQLGDNTFETRLQGASSPARLLTVSSAESISAMVAAAGGIGDGFGEAGNVREVGP